VVFVAAARAFDKAAAAGDREFRRKTRTLAGNYQILRLEPRLLLPGVNPVWLQYVSHKLGRLIVPYALVAMLLSSAWLAPGSAVFAVILAAQLGFYGLAAYGAVLDRRGRREPTRPGRAPDAVPELRPQ
jgi:hypothetical protein